MNTINLLSNIKISYFSFLDTIFKKLYVYYIILEIHDLFMIRNTEMFRMLLLRNLTYFYDIINILTSYN